MKVPEDFAKISQSRWRTPPPPRVRGAAAAATTRPGRGSAWSGVQDNFAGRVGAIMQLTGRCISPAGVGVVVADCRSRRNREQTAEISSSSILPEFLHDWCKKFTLLLSKTLCIGIHNIFTVFLHSSVPPQTWWFAEHIHNIHYFENYSHTYGCMMALKVRVFLVTFS